MNRLLVPAAAATLALALTACSDPSKAYTPVDELPSATPPETAPPTTPPPTTPIDDDATADPVDRVDPMDPAPLPTDPMDPMDPEVPPSLDPVPHIDEATRPPPVDPALEDDADPVPPTP